MKKNNFHMYMPHRWIGYGASTKRNLDTSGKIIKDVPAFRKTSK
jgi:hypothetical protein